MDKVYKNAGYTVIRVEGSILQPQSQDYLDVQREGTGRWVRRDIGAWHCACSTEGVGRLHLKERPCPECNVKPPRKTE
jgi:hypothetical protein